MSEMSLRRISLAHFRLTLKDATCARAKTPTFLAWPNGSKKHFPTYPLPKGKVAKWLIWLVGKTVDPSFTRYWVSRNLGHDFVSRSDKIQTELGVQFRPIEPGLVEMFQQLIDQGVFE